MGGDWGNWIGNTALSTSTRQELVWNLSQIKNQWGEQITYWYTNTENYVGNGAVALSTEASYLQKITDSWGHEVDFVYLNKLAGEYQDPHTEAVEPDAYQERYERMYLDRIYVKTDNVSYYEIDFRYSFLNSGNTTKRLLASTMQVTTPSSLQSPLTRFEYNASGSVKGCLSKVYLPTGGTVTYGYNTTGVDITQSDRETSIK